MTTIAIEELELHLREVLARVQAGERVVVASDGEPVAEISPCDPLAALERAFPGMQRATKHMRDIPLPNVRLNAPADAVELIREEREDREFLR